jgi:hypothetical protein
MEAGVKKKLVLNGCWCYKPRFQDPIRQILFATLCKSEPRIQDPVCQTYSYCLLLLLLLGSTVTVTVIYTFNGGKWMLVINGC